MSYDGSAHEPHGRRGNPPTGHVGNHGDAGPQSGSRLFSSMSTALFSRASWMIWRSWPSSNPSKASGLWTRTCRPLSTSWNMWNPSGSRASGCRKPRREGRGKASRNAGRPAEARQIRDAHSVFTCLSDFCEGTKSSLFGKQQPLRCARVLPLQWEICLYRNK